MTQKIVSKANSLRDAGRTREAIRVLKPLLKSKDFKVAVNAHDATGLAYMNEEQFNEALKYYKKALAIVTKNGWLERSGGIVRDIAIAYKNAKKYKQAEKYFLQSIDCAKRYSDEGQGRAASLGITYSKLALNYTDMRQFAKAKKVFLQAGILLKKSNHAYWQLIGAIDYCSFLIATKKYAPARAKLQQLVIAGVAQDKIYKVMEALILWAMAADKLGDKEEAKRVRTFAERWLKTFDSPMVIKKFKKLLAGK